MLSQNSINWRYHTVFDLDTLAQALPERSCIGSARDQMKKIAWPEGWDANNSILTTARPYPDGRAAFIQIVGVLQRPGKEEEMT